MADEPSTKPPVEVIPSVEGSISAVGSANAPFIHFGEVPVYGVLNGVIRITLTIGRVLPTPDQRIATDSVVTAHLRMNLPAR